MSGANPPFDSRVAAALASASPADAKAIRFFRDNREEVLVASASALAAKIGTSDATVIRAARALGYSSLDALRRVLAGELRRDLSPASRLARTLGEVKAHGDAVLQSAVETQIRGLEALCRDIGPTLFGKAVDCLAGASRVFIFGIGPSGAIAEYFAIQLGRFGVDAASLTDTGLRLADRLLRLRQDDLILILAYGRVYAELEALIDWAGAVGAKTLLVTDTLGGALRGRVDTVLSVARGESDSFSMHTTTLGMIEALLVGLAARRPEATVESLRTLNMLRASVTGKAMDLPGGKKTPARPSAQRPKTHG